MNIIDTHAHIYLENFSNDIENIILRAEKSGIKKILLPNIDETTINPLKNLVIKYPHICFPMMGLHPTSVTSEWKQQLHDIKKELTANNYIAIGEIGIDLYWEKDTLNIQQKVFEAQLQLSVELDLPVAIHSRDAIPEVINSINKIEPNKLKGVFHSFGGNQEELEAILALKEFYIGINGVVTFKNSGLKEIIHHCPIDKIIIETDAPYLSPVPYRGKRNEPSYIIGILETLAQIYNINIREMAAQTTRNAKMLFNIESYPHVWDFSK